MVLYTLDGVRMWKRDLGNGVIPGVWYAPFISFDLDQDGVDEIWFVNNLNPNIPFSLNARVLERIDPLTGETTGQWTWPDNTIDDTMSHSYRCLLYTSHILRRGRRKHPRHFPFCDRACKPCGKCGAETGI